MKVASQLDKEVFLSQNKLRTDPKSYLPWLKDRLSKFNGKMIVRGQSKSNLMTHEGPSAVEEAI